MKIAIKPKSGGFTLVELLVVIVIVAALAALSFTVGPKMMRKAKATEAMQNIRQIGPLITTYAADHDMKLPAARGPVTQPDGTTSELQWNEVCIAVLFPDTPITEFKTKAWWEKNKNFMRNPLFKAWTPLKTGFALNEMIAENIANAAEEKTGEPLSTPVALASIPDPGRTPLIAPYDDYIYRLESTGESKRFTVSPVKDLLVDGKMPILFVDGHIESVTPTEYVNRKLAEFPLAP